MKWISIKDKLPEFCEGVLVAGKGMHGTYVVQLASIYCGDKLWHWFTNDTETTRVGISAPWSDITSWIEIEDIEYWMEIPSTYHLDNPNIDQPDRSKREESKCTRCRLFGWAKEKSQESYIEQLEQQIESGFHLSCTCDMRCSEHCGNTVREVQ